MSTKCQQVLTTNVGPKSSTAISSPRSTSTVLSGSHLPTKPTTSTPQLKTQQTSTPVTIQPIASTSGKMEQQESGGSNAFNDTISSCSIATNGSTQFVNSSTSLQSSNSPSNSPISKRPVNSSSITRIRPQSSYSARVLIFEDSDHELNYHGLNASNPATSLPSDVGLKSNTGLELVASSPKNDSSIFLSQSLLRNLNLTKSSSGGLSGSSASLAPRGYGAFLRKLSYNQYSYSLRSASSGML